MILRTFRESPNYLLSFICFVVVLKSYHGVLLAPPSHNFPYGVVLNGTFIFLKKCLVVDGLVINWGLLGGCLADLSFI